MKSFKKKTVQRISDNADIQKYFQPQNVLFFNQQKEILSFLVSSYSEATWFLLNFAITLLGFTRFDIFFLLHY